MKKLFIAIFTVFAGIACQTERNTPNPDPGEDRDWYILRAPENRQIQTVYGDIDGTLLITDRKNIFYTRDKGKTWTQANYNNPIGLSGFGLRNDTLFVMDSETSTSTEPGNRYATSPFYFSVDNGVNWQELNRRPDTQDLKIPLNFAYSGNGIRYEIDQLVSNGNIQYLGIKSESGDKITLPQYHYLTNVYFDNKSRLYIAASAPICKANGVEEYCKKDDYRGTLYVSKRRIDY